MYFWTVNLMDCAMWVCLVGCTLFPLRAFTFVHYSHNGFGCTPQDLHVLAAMLILPNENSRTCNLWKPHHFVSIHLVLEWSYISLFLRLTRFTWKDSTNGIQIKCTVINKIPLSLCFFSFFLFKSIQKRESFIKKKIRKFLRMALLPGKKMLTENNSDEYLGQG